MSIRVLIADDHPLIRSGVRNELSNHEEIEVIGEAADGDETIRKTEELYPDILLLDIHMPGSKSPQILARFQRTAPATRVIILTEYNDALTVLGMLKAGVKGYIVKDEDPGTLVDAIQAVMKDKTWLSPTVAAIVIDAFGKEKSNEGSWQLTDRDKGILNLLKQGFDYDQIGKEMLISEQVVRYHIKILIERLGLRSSSEAVELAIRNGWI